ncbi:MAG TPA: protein-disulfide reductase DsbD [Burkholderiaceae bacterium]|jgi:thiol:disulfide interchange protein DsbD
MSRFIKAVFLGLLLALRLSSAHADDFLDPEQAFKLTLNAVDDKTVEAAWVIAPGYYMYKEQFKAVAEAATLGEPQFPKPESKFDETFQKTVEIYHDALKVRIPITQANGAFKLTVTGQGCAVKGLCYPPMNTTFEVRLNGFGGTTGIKRVETIDAAPAAVTALPAETPAVLASPAAPAPAAADNAIDSALKSGHFWTVVIAFFVAGVLLSLTPCVLPMLPILSSIIVGSGQATRSRGLLLASSYSLGMALLYTALGVAAGLAGHGLAAALQTPWVLAVFSLALVLFSLSMFGAYELQLPSSLTGGLSEASQRMPAGKVFSVFIMGGISALIVSPCVAAPLAGALVYISQTRDVLLGGTALFALACGMSVPLLLLGASAGALLPRAGAWMDGVKHFFGMLLLAVALYTVQPILPGALPQVLWGALLIASAAMLGLFEAARQLSPLGWLRKTVAVLTMAFGLMQVLGAATGGTDPLKPLAGFGVSSAKVEDTAVHFQRISSVAELDAAVAKAGKPVMLDFYADWCVSCKEMERDTFTDAGVRAKLKSALLLQADVTANTPADKELLKRFNLFGPPGIIFFDAKGQEAAQRVVGFQDAPTFVASLATVGL